MNFSSTRKRAVTAAIAVGAVLGSFGVAGALSNRTTPSTPSTPSTPATDAPDPTTAGSSTGVDQSNSDPTHEAGESAQHEADETAGKGFGRDHHGGRHGHSNTDPTHEAGESAARQAEEAARDAAAGTDASTPTTAG